jgi:cytochrome P450
VSSDPAPDLTAFSPDEIDLASPDSFLGGIPHAWFEHLRRSEPLSWTDEPDGRGFWSFVRHRDVFEVSKDTATYSSEIGGTSLEDLEPDQIEIRKSMIDTDPPRHGELRDITRRDFTPRAVGVYEEQIRQTFRWLLADALERRTFDFVEHVSVELPMRVFAELLGAPLEDRLFIVELGNRILGTDDPEFSDALTREERQAYRELPFSSPAAAEMFAYGQKLAALRRREPRDDLVTDLLDATPGGRPLTEREYNVYFLLLATAGNETTRHAISSTVHLLSRHPEVVARLQEEPALCGKAADEMMRWATPVLHFRRTATRDVEAYGRTIRRGDKVLIWYAGANWDADVFADPYVVDPARTPNKHLAFGLGGPHFCLGAHLARLELRIVLEELVPYLDRIELLGEPELMRSNFFNGIKRMPVRYAPAT